MIEISKELLSEVLNCDVDKYTIVSSSEITQIRIWKKDAEMWDYRSCDIHHLAHKCKEWAINKGYVLRICYVLENDTRELCFVETTLLKSDQYLSDYYDMDSNTEVEAIIKACEWILKEIKK